MTESTMTKDEASLLLYLEARMVDNDGTVDPRMMNKTDFDIAERWGRSGFIEFGRLKAREIEYLASKLPASSGRPSPRSHYVRFTPQAWEAAHRERRARSERTIKRWEKANFVPVGLIDRAREEKRKAQRDKLASLQPGEARA